ncbi:MAG TPA: hypothetical protein VMZ28_08945, partial [Kofleriaceae bacterium]|nr:hypothetical protein [Kofleriaceae bacterium]
ARAAHDADRLAQASAAAAAAGDARAAVTLAREARAARPGDGSLAFLLGERLAGARDVTGAAAVWADLLACGAHGRAWHRHEVSGRLLKLAASGDAAVRAITAALRAPRTCATVEPDDLAPYLEGVVKQLSGPIPP